MAFDIQIKIYFKNYKRENAVNILKLNKLNTKQISDIKRLAGLCGGYSAYYEEFSPNREICFFLCYRDSELISFLSFLAVESSSLTVSNDVRKNLMEAEVTAMTHPDGRRKGLFSRLYKCALEQLDMLGITNVYCAVPLEYQKSKICKGLSHIEYLQKLDFESAKEISKSFNKPKHLQLNYAPSADSDVPTAYYLIEKKFLLRSKSIGVCHLSEESEFTNVWGVEINKPYRNQGYGLKLMNFVINDYFNCSSKPLVLNVTSKNVNACKLYKRCGFKLVEQIEYYHLA